MALSEDIKHLLKLMAAMNYCINCGSISMGAVCSTCDATSYVSGDAYPTRCVECSRGFATTNPDRDLCCFCMKREGEFNGRNRRADPKAPRRPTRAADTSTGTGTMSHAALASPGTLGYAERPRPAIENAGIRTGEIIAYRVWKLNVINNVLTLRSMAVDCIWSPGEVMTMNSVLDQCSFGRDKWKRIPPHIGAGIHAFKSLVNAIDQYEGFSSSSPVVYGTVALWGEVIEHALGYRAEFGRVNTLDKISYHNKIPDFVLPALQKKYGVNDRSHLDFKIG